jgi:hypothetical protein
MSAIWKVVGNVSEIQLFAHEPFGDSFVYHATEAEAKRVVHPMSVFARWIGNSHLAIPASTTAEQLRTIHDRVAALVEARRFHLQEMTWLLEGRSSRAETSWEQVARQFGQEEPAISEYQIWRIVTNGFQGVQLHSLEPFGGSFVHHTTQEIANDVFGVGLVHSQWGGASGTHVCISRTADLAKVRRLRHLVQAAVEKRAAELEEVKEAFEQPVFEGRPLLRAVMNGFHGIELHPAQEPLRGFTPASQRYHGIVPRDDYFVYNNTEAIAREIFNYGVHHNWACTQGHNIEIPRNCTVEQAQQILEKLNQVVQARAEEVWTRDALVAMVRDRRLPGCNLASCWSDITLRRKICA